MYVLCTRRCKRKRTSRKAGKGGSGKQKHQGKLKRIPKRMIIKEIEDDSVKKWQTECTKSTKGKITKDFFADVKERLNMNIKLTGHRPRKKNSYLHRFKIIKAPTCPCGNSDQKINHLIFECNL